MLERLTQQLFSAQDPTEMWSILNQLCSLSAEMPEALLVVAAYLDSKQMVHLHSLILGQLVSYTKASDTSLRPFFQQHLHDTTLGFWSIVGYIRIAESAAYPELVDLITSPDELISSRACAIKQISLHSKQQFDRYLPQDPGKWRSDDLRLTEVQAWQDARYPLGEGYPTPIRHPALDRPVTHLERLMAELDHILAKKRLQEQDPANPTDWLVPASPTTLIGIETQWRLPAIYKDFLTRFSPVHVTLYSALFINWLQLFGAETLLEQQAVYANDYAGKRRADWPPQLVMIGCDGDDPYVLDLSRATENDAPVMTAIENQGDWYQVAESFQSWIEGIIKNS